MKVLTSPQHLEGLMRMELRRNMPAEFCDFARLLAKNVGSETTPKQFCALSMRLAMDLMSGRIKHHSLTKKKENFFDLLLYEGLPRIASAVYSREFTDEAEKIIQRGEWW